MQDQLGSLLVNDVQRRVDGHAAVLCNGETGVSR